MKSKSGEGGVTFEVLQLRLRALMNVRLHNGEYTERGLARLLGVSQPQLHNVLKGTRGLRTVLADRMLSRLGMTTLELLDEAELTSALGLRRTMARRWSEKS